MHFEVHRGRAAGAPLELHRGLLRHDQHALGGREPAVRDGERVARSGFRQGHFRDSPMGTNHRQGEDRLVLAGVTTQPGPIVRE